MLQSFRYDWPGSLAFFGSILPRWANFIFRSGYLPKSLGILPAVDGLGWVANSLRPSFIQSPMWCFFFVFSFGGTAPSALAPDQRLEDPGAGGTFLR
jgi:hypothetical protein